jgi:transcriptional regulator with XRE-family HTH domain
MSTQPSVVQGTYNPAKLLDFLCKTLSIATDTKLAAQFGVGPPLISKIRHGRYGISSEFLIKIHDVTGISIPTLREIMGDRRKKHRFSKNVKYSLESRAEERPPSADRQSAVQ